MERSAGDVTGSDLGPDGARTGGAVGHRPGRLWVRCCSDVTHATRSTRRAAPYTGWSPIGAGSEDRGSCRSPRDEFGITDPDSRSWLYAGDPDGSPVSRSAADPR